MKNLGHEGLPLTEAETSFLHMQNVEILILKVSFKSIYSNNIEKVSSPNSKH